MSGVAKKPAVPFVLFRMPESRVPQRGAAAAAAQKATRKRKRTRTAKKEGNEEKGAGDNEDEQKAAKRQRLHEPEVFDAPPDAETATTEKKNDQETTGKKKKKRRKRKKSAPKVPKAVLVRKNMEASGVAYADAHVKPPWRDKAVGFNFAAGENPETGERAAIVLVRGAFDGTAMAAALDDLELMTSMTCFRQPVRRGEGVLCNTERLALCHAPTLELKDNNFVPPGAMPRLVAAAIDSVVDDVFTFERAHGDGDADHLATVDAKRHELADAAYSVARVSRFRNGYDKIGTHRLSSSLIGTNYRQGGLLFWAGGPDTGRALVLRNRFHKRTLTLDLVPGDVIYLDPSFTHTTDYWLKVTEMGTETPETGDVHMDNAQGPVLRPDAGPYAGYLVVVGEKVAGCGDSERPGGDFTHIVEAQGPAKGTNDAVATAQGPNEAAPSLPPPPKVERIRYDTATFWGRSYMGKSYGSLGP